MDLKERDKYRDVLKQAAPDLRKYLAIDDGLLVEFAAVDVISLEEKESIQNPQLTYHQKVDKLLEFIRLKIHIAFFPFMKLLKEKDKLLHKRVLTFISEDNTHQELVDKRPSTSTSSTSSGGEGESSKATISKKAPHAGLVREEETWSSAGEFSTEPKLPSPWAITIHPNGDVAVTNNREQAQIFSKEGDPKFPFDKPGDDNHTSLSDIAVSRNNYILPGHGKILFYNENGDFLKKEYPHRDGADPTTLAIDSKRGRIVVGLTCNTISIHHGDGREISRWSSPSKMIPYSLDVTTNNEIAITYDDGTLNLIECRNNRIVPCPEVVNRWLPMAVCCSKKQGEIFVVNDGDKSVYRYTADGKCLGCIISGLDSPMGIAITKDEQQLYVVEQDLSLVKKFLRPGIHIDKINAYSRKRPSKSMPLTSSDREGESSKAKISTKAPNAGASIMPPDAPASQPHEVQQANTARRSASSQQQPRATPSHKGASTMPPDAPASQPQKVQQANTARKCASPAPQPCTTPSQGAVQQPPQENSRNSLPELVDQLDIKTEVNKPSPDSSCEKNAIIKKDAAPRWKQSGQFYTGDFDKLCGLAINQHGDIALTSWVKGVKVYSRSGEVKYTVYTSSGAVDVAVTHDNKYVTNPFGQRCIVFHDSLGKELSTAPVKNIFNYPSVVNSVAIDTKGRIIVGQYNNIISIHNPDGSLISKFASQSRPYLLAITSNDEIVSSFYDPTLYRGISVQMMDYSGNNIRVIQPPPDVKVWGPSYVCCRQGEIFVVNGGAGNPTGVYRYTSEGEYLGCVTTDVRDPAGIALSEDGNELFVADYGDNMVKIFQRQ